MHGEILAIGTELLAPGRVETNAADLTGALADLGIPVVFRGVIGDDEEGIASAVRHALERAELVILTGGLGPTLDDRTRDGVARALGRELRRDAEVAEWLHERFRRRGIEMPEVNLRQAMVPEGAEVLSNRRGSAPGLWIPAGVRGETGNEERRERFVVLLPGPPREMRPMFEEHVRPRLASYAGSHRYRTRKLWVAGLPESTVEQAVVGLYRNVANPETTILAGPGQVEIRLTAKAPSVEEADALIESLAAPMRERLGDALFTESEENLEELVGKLLRANGFSLSLAESITGGLIAHRITEVPGASEYFERGYVTYSNESKTELLGVPEELFAAVGAVSEKVALAMARGARDRAGTDFAVAVTGIAGPAGGGLEKPVGLVFIGLSSPRGDRAERFLLPGQRSYVKQWTAQIALDLLRRELLGL